MSLDIAVTRKLGDFKLDISLNVPVGVTALIGMSGAGKTSLLRIIAGLDRPDSGRITLGDRVFSDQRGQFLKPEKRHIGFVFQEPRLLPHMGVMANIRLGARGKAIDKGLLSRIGVEDLSDRPVAKLSGGEQQRVMLARALAGAPDLLLFDEPLSALDPHSRERLLALFSELLPTLGIPVLYVTHQMEEAGQVAKRFALIRDGQIIRTGDAATVLSAYGGSTLEAGQSFRLDGEVDLIGENGLARVRIGKQRAEVPAGRLTAGRKVGLRLSARDLILARHKPGNISARNALTGVIVSFRPLADHQVEVVMVVEDQSISVIVTEQSRKDMALETGQDAVVLFKSAAVELI